ncbi:hypothetical protein BGZ49_010429 [Haplosporangium sp. Z 27]|nr:hypothetical protein BGZ49_010429 [Haplosporangium sp. Z 27]
MGRRLAFAHFHLNTASANERVTRHLEAFGDLDIDDDEDGEYEPEENDQEEEDEDADSNQFETDDDERDDDDNEYLADESEEKEGRFCSILNVRFRPTLSNDGQPLVL